MADWTCSDCNWVNRDFAERCLSCGQARQSGTASSPPADVQAGVQEAPWDRAPASPQLPLVANLAVRAGHTIRFVDFFRYGSVVVFVSLVISTVYVWFRYLA